MAMIKYELLITSDLKAEVRMQKAEVDNGMMLDSGCWIPDLINERHSKRRAGTFSFSSREGKGSRPRGIEKFIPRGPSNNTRGKVLLVALTELLGCLGLFGYLSVMEP